MQLSRRNLFTLFIHIPRRYKEQSRNTEHNVYNIKAFFHVDRIVNLFLRCYIYRLVNFSIGWKIWESFSSK